MSANCVARLRWSRALLGTRDIAIIGAGGFFDRRYPSK